MLKILSTLLFIGIAALSFSQKTVHIPNYLQNPNDVNGAQFSWSKTAQSENFILIWGNTVGVNPANYPDPNLAFNPSKILDTMEFIYDEFKLLGFLDDAPGTNLAQYKVPIVMYGTWGANGAQGFANGGDADGIIGAFWVHPSAMLDGGVAAHEFAHSLQAQNNIDYRSDHGLGNSWQNAGIFWECHANFMRNLLYPQFVTAWGMDVYHYETWGDWKNTYENYAILMAIMESEGIDMVNRLWRESIRTEYPLQAYKRLAGYNQARFNDSLYQYARRMATYDYNYKNLGSRFRQKRNADLNNWLPTIQNAYSILRPVAGGAAGRYEIPIEQAPEEYAYNVIPLYPHADSCAVIVKFKGQTGVNAHAGWRYGFVAAKANGTVSRYSPTYSANTGEIHFRLQSGETRLYLVVMGAPPTQITTNTSNDTWRGYPKHFRFPYELTISGAVPEGYQTPANFRSQLKTNGHIHANGGGWVQNSASVAASVYVGPTAIVLGNSNISGQVRIEGTSLVRQATMSGNVRVLGNAFVDRGTYSSNAKIQGNAFVINATMSGSALVGMRARVDNYVLSGTVEVGGDVVVYNDAGNCNNGVHYRLTNYYDNKLLECDGRTASHSANSDVNSSYSAFSDAQMALSCSCGGTQNVVADSLQIGRPTCTNPAGGSVQFFISNSCPPLSYSWSKGAETGSNLSGLFAGNYSFTITDGLGKQGVFAVQIPAPPALSGSMTSQPFDCASTEGGTVGAVLGGGTAPFAWLWSGGETEPALQNLPPGNYALTVTDALGCSFAGAAEIGLSGQLNAAISATPVDCSGTGGGLLETELSSGIAPFTYLWSNGETEAELQNLPPGNYELTVTDALGCTFAAAAEIALSGQLNATISATPVDCAGTSGGTLEAMLLSGTAPFTHLWSSGETEPVIQNLPPGNYALTVTDALGCTFAGSAEIGLSGQLNAAISATPVDCAGTSGGTLEAMLLSGTAPFTHLWSSGETEAELQNLPPGNYGLTVTDALGCTFAAAAEIGLSGHLDAEISATPIDCSSTGGGALETALSSGTAPFVHLWSNGETEPGLQNLPPGNYALTVTDALGCSFAGSAEIGLSGQLNATISATPVDCSGTGGGALETALSSGTAPFAYLWNSGETEPELQNLPPGNYELTVTDALGCTFAGSAEITFSGQLNAAISATPVSCFGLADGSAEVAPASGTPPFSYLWSNGETGISLQNLPAGGYGVTLTDANGCKDSTEIALPEPPALALQLAATDVRCFGAADGLIDLVVAGGTPGYAYAWSNGMTSAGLAGLEPGDYAVTITDTHGCTASAETVIASPELLSLGLQAPPSLCPLQGGTAGAVATGGTPPYSYLWGNASTGATIAVTGPGVHAVTISDAYGCTASAEANVSPAAALELDLTHSPLLCPDSPNGFAAATPLTGTAPFAWLWNTGATDSLLTGLSGGSYTVTVGDAHGCTGIQTVHVPEAPPIAAQFGTVHAGGAASADGGILLSGISGGLPPYTYLWSTGAGTPSLENILPGDYGLTITDALGCTQTYAFSVSFGVATDDSERSGFRALLAPNPSAGGAGLFLHVPQPEQIEIRVVDALGRQRYFLETQLPEGENRIALPDDLTSGLYWIRVRDAAGRSGVFSWVVTE